MINFVLAVTTFNRLSFLKNCLDSWYNTKSNDVNWTIIIADDGSTDGTLEYLDKLQFENTRLVLIKNKKIGVHQQVNTIIKELVELDFDFCFKIDDDISFLKPGWDFLYYNQAVETGNDHLVFCDKNWCPEQFLEKAVKHGKLIGRIPMLDAHGFFYTLSPRLIKTVGYFDANLFGYRGMGHVDYSMRCARAGFTDIDTPWDIQNSNDYITAFKNNYSSALPKPIIGIYDSFFRKKKEAIILRNDRLYVPFYQINKAIYSTFTAELIEAFTDKAQNFEKEKNEILTWYKKELEKTKNWYESQNSHLPNWFLKFGKIFKLFR